MFGIGNMEDNMPNNAQAMDITGAQAEARIESMISRTFFWMGMTLLLAFGASYGTYQMILQGIFNVQQVVFRGWIALFGGLAMVVWMSWGWHKMSYATLAILLMVFGVVEGFGLTYIFLVYSIGSIMNIFLMTCIMFFGLALIGYKLKVDISNWGTVLFGALLALIVGYLINMFIGSGPFDFVLNIIGLVIFGGLVIYKMSMLKQMALIGDDRIALVMALGLYLTFINIFLILLRLFGGGRE